MSLVDPEPINGGDVQYVATMNLANGARRRPVLVQVDADCTFHKAERGRPQVEVFERAAWQAEGVDPVYPMNASYTTVDAGLPGDPLRAGSGEAGGHGHEEAAVRIGTTDFTDSAEGVSHGYAVG